MKKLILALFGLSLAGCATFGDGDSSIAQSIGLSSEKSTRYSENPQMSVPANRQYRRMSRSRMEEESELQSQAGSMWVGEGQTAYLFTQNKTRREGDILGVKLDGPAQKQVETKVGVIKKLLKQLEEQQQQNELNQKMAESAPNGGEGRTPASEPAKAPAAAKEEKEDVAAEIGAIPSRIVERMPDGNYRVKGAQPFMIGKREYKVIVTGIIRPEDFNDEGVSSTKLLDPQFDVVSIRRNKNSEAPSVL